MREMSLDTTSELRPTQEMEPLQAEWFARYSTLGRRAPWSITSFVVQIYAASLVAGVALGHALLG